MKKFLMIASLILTTTSAYACCSTIDDLIEEQRYQQWQRHIEDLQMENRRQIEQMSRDTDAFIQQRIQTNRILKQQCELAGGTWRLDDECHR